VPKKKPKFNKNKVKRLKQKLNSSQKNLPMNRAKKEMTSLERQVADMLDDLKIEYEREKPLKYMQGYRYFDFHLIDYGVLIEVDGAYWHGDVGNKPSYAGMMAKKNDATKNWLAKKDGFKMLRIKEKELIDNYNQIKENISSLIKESEK
tara:strand:+ start:114 stop:560 length:447 start_codon:yes stop_codon:yes gene_type:complete